MSLGLYLKHLRSFESSCHQLDVKCAAILAQKAGSEEWKPTFNKMVMKNKLLLKIDELKSVKNDLMEQHQFMSLLYPNTQPLDLLYQEAEDKGQEIETGKTKNRMPFFSNLYLFTMMCPFLQHA